jgi:anti-anti-sigma factor
MAANISTPSTGSSERRRIVSHVDVAEQGDVRIVSFQRDEKGMVGFDIVRSYFASLMLEHTHGWNRVVLDLSGVPALDSAALGPLVQKLREVQEARGKLVLTGVDAPALREIFALTRFDRVFPILPTRATAVATAAG